MIQWTKNLKNLVEEAGVPIREITSDYPGEIVYEDDVQIVAHAFLHKKPRFR
jgi:hypothetical protein